MDPLTTADSSKKKIPVKDAYYQLINNVLSFRIWPGGDASDIEKGNIQHLCDIQGPDPDQYPQRAYECTRHGHERPAKGYVHLLRTISIHFAGFFHRYHPKGQDRPVPRRVSVMKEEHQLKGLYIYSGIAGSWVDTTAGCIQQVFRCGRYLWPAGGLCDRVPEN